MGRFQRFMLIGAAAMAFAGPALACSIAPPPPPPAALPGTPEADVVALETAWNTAHGLKYAMDARDWTLKQQEQLFDEAASIVLVRHVREDVVKGMPKKLDHMNGERMAVVKPLRWLKGSGSSAEFNIGASQPPPCGQMVGHDAIYGQPGDVFIVYLSADKALMQAYSLDRIIAPRTIEMLTKMPE